MPAVVQDTNILYRGGRDGLRFVRAEATAFLAAGGVRAPDWRARMAVIGACFAARRLSPGGSADLLAATLFLDALDGVVP
jgi:triphosphoribosyl-dephospho-CoA synthase